MKDFDAERRPLDEAFTPDELAFQFGGAVFHRMPRLPGSLLFRIGRLEEGRNVMEDAGEIVGIIVACIVPGERDQMKALLRGDPWNPDVTPLAEMPGVSEPSIEDMITVTDWLMQEATGRPLERSGSSEPSSATAEPATQSTPTPPSPGSPSSRTSASAAS